MKLAIYVHDFRLEIGHSNALIELIRHLPKTQLHQFSEIEVISQISTPLNILFSDYYNGPLKWTKVPLGGMKPALFNSIFFHIWTWFYNKFFQAGENYRIGVGACCFGVDASSVQFIQYQWTINGLRLERKNFFKYIYKKILFFYYEWCENKIYQSKNIKIFTAANFLTDYLRIRYKGVNAQTFYSSVNLERFSIIDSNRMIIKQSLLKIHPELAALDITLPTYIFVGAYERKGLHRALALLKSSSNVQFIVVGSPSLGQKIKWPEEIKIFKIKFSKNLRELYSLSDAFIFPTIYEPFGLVLFEAMAMGLEIITNQNEVGASELLIDLPNVHFCDDESFLLPSLKIKSIEDKTKIRFNRLQKLKNISWQDSSEQLARFLWEFKETKD